MGKIDHAIREFQSLDALAKEARWINRTSPLGKLFLTILFIILTVSFSKYDLTGLICMFLYPLVAFTVGELSFGEALYRLRVVLPLVCVVGVFNPFFDRAVVFTIGGIGITGGVLSMVTLMIKAVLTVLASYLLIATTSIEKLCAALRHIHVPQMIVIEILLIYRYITLLLREARNVTQAYALRAPNERGIAFRAWGPLLGQMLLRSMSRAEELYDSMCIRGFRGEFPAAGEGERAPGGLAYCLIWMVILLALRIFPVGQIVGNLFV